MKVIAFDLETASAAEMHTYGPGFIRLCGWGDVDGGGPVHISTDPADVVAALLAADAITGHNIINFDLMAFAVQRFITFDQYEALCLKSFDTMITEMHFNPVAAQGAQPKGYYKLGAVAERYGLDGKDLVDFEGKREIVRRVRGDKEADRMKAGKTELFSVLDVLAALYGGYDKIPVGDPDYRRYLVKDIHASGGLYLAHADRMRTETQDSRRYIRREHWTQTSMGRTTLEGARVDTDLTMRRWSEGQARLDAGKQMLHEKFGMPTDGKKPHVSNKGKAAFRQAILSTGISEAALQANWPTGKDGFLLTGKDVLDSFIPLFEGRFPLAADLCRTIKAMNGERTVYGTVLDHTVNGRVHPYIGPDQASGRWSMKDPGLTVLGKRGGKAHERAMILSDNDDEVLVAIDADQVDARGVAGMCQDSEYMKLFAPGMDLHSEVAWRVWSSPAQHGPRCHRGDRPDCCSTAVKCHCEKRDQAKVFGHGFSYGLGAKSMAAQHGVHVDVAWNFVRGMTEAFPRLAEWKDEVREQAGVLPYGETAPANDRFRILHTGFGRPVRVERERAYTQAPAQLGQGTTRDIMAHAILSLPTPVRRKIRAVIHDEILISIPKDGAQEHAEKIADGMAFDFRGVAITFGCSRVSRSWAGCYGAEYETAA